MRIAPFLLASTLIVGCTPLTAYVTRDATENEVSMDPPDYTMTKRGGPHRFSAIAFTASRRGAFITNDSRLTQGKTIFCAEPPPDAISAVLATSAAELGLSKGENMQASASLKEAYQTAAASIAARTQYVEIYRTYVFALCQLQANNADPNVLAQFASVTEKTLAEAKGAALAAQVKVEIIPSSAAETTSESKPAATDDARCDALNGDQKKTCDACKSKPTDDARKQCVDVALKPIPQAQTVTDCSKYSKSDDKTKCEKELADRKQCEAKQGEARTTCDSQRPMPKPAPEKKV